MKKNLFISTLLVFSILGCNGNVSESVSQSETMNSSEESSSIEASSQGKESSVETFSDEQYLAMSDDEYIKNFKPILRFALASDLHIKESSNDSYYKRAIKICDMSYSIAEDKNNNYQNLDAILLAGDMVGNGKVAEYQRVKDILDSHTKEETKIITTLGNHDFWADKENTVSNYLSVFTDQKEDQIITINGISIISICASENGEQATFNTKKKLWLNMALRSASKANPDMPIFVMSHYPQFNTVYGSYNTHFGTSDLDEVFKDYPQVVYLSGHSHFPIADPRSLYQKDYTAINTGTTAYSCLMINGLDGYDKYYYPSDLYGSYSTKTPYSGQSYELGDLQIVEVNKFGSLLIKGYDLISETNIFNRLVRFTTDKTKFITNEMKKESSISPEFDSDAKIIVKSLRNDNAILDFPSSNSDEYVESYRGELYLENGELVNKYYALGDEFLFPNPTLFMFKLKDLTPNTNYIFKIYAVNAYNKESINPLKIDFKTLS